jgi:hypothetical protein
MKGWLILLSPLAAHPPRLPDQQLLDGRELAPARVMADYQHPLDDDKRQHVQAVLVLSRVKLDTAQAAVRPGRLDTDAAGDAARLAGTTTARRSAGGAGQGVAGD